MKNRQVFKIIRKRLDPWFADRGFVPAHDPHHRGLTGWSRPHGSLHLNVWCQSDKWQFDPFIGSQFTDDTRETPVARFSQEGEAVKLGIAPVLAHFGQSPEAPMNMYSSGLPVSSYSVKYTASHRRTSSVTSSRSALASVTCWALGVVVPKHFSSRCFKSRVAHPNSGISAVWSMSRME